MAAERTMLVKIAGDAKGLSRAINQSTTFLGTLGPAALAAGSALAAGLAAGTVVAVKNFADFEAGIQEVFTLLPGLSSEAMGQMQDDVRRFAVETGTATNEVLPALYQALSAGVPQDNVFNFLETANQAALGGVTDLETAVDGITSVVNAFGDKIGGAAEASDLMFTAVRLGKTTFGELAAYMSNVAPIAASTGVAFSDVTAALATMTAQGVPTAQATTQLRQLFVELGDAGSQAGQIFERVAGQSLQEFLATTGNTADALALVSGAADEAGVPISQLFGSIEAGSAALALTGDNAESFSSNLDEMAASAGATEAAYETMDQGLTRAWQRFRVFGDELLLTVGEQLAPLLQSLADDLLANLPAIESTVAVVIASVGQFVEAVRPGLDWLSSWWASTSPTIIAAAVTLRNSFSDVWGKIQAGAESLYATINEVFGPGGEGSDDLTDFLETLEEWAETIGDIFDSAATIVLAIIGFIAEAGRVAWSLFGDELTNIARVLWQTVTQMFSGALAAIHGLLEVFAGLFTGDWSRFWYGMRDLLSGVLTTIDALLRGALQVIGSVLSAATQGWYETFRMVGAGIIDYWRGLWDNIVGRIVAVRGSLVGVLRATVAAAGNVWKTLKTTLATPVNWVARNVFNRLSGAVNRVAGALGGGTLVPMLPVPLVTFHEGGIVGSGGRVTYGPLKNDEMIIKARKGEEVLPAGHPRHIKSGEPYDPLATAIGGPFSWVSDALRDRGGELLTRVLRPILSRVESLVNLFSSQFGPSAAFPALAARKLLDTVRDWTQGVAKTTEGGTLGAGHMPGRGWRALVGHMARTSVPHVVTSTVRNSVTTSGRKSRHALGLAADFSIPGHGNRGYGSTGLKRIFEAFLPVAKNLHELILAGAPYNIKKGRRVPPYASGRPGQPGNHWNHVHAALEGGGVFNDPFIGTVALAETPRARPEIVTPQKILADTFRAELALNNQNVPRWAETLIDRIEKLELSAEIDLTPVTDAAILKMRATNRTATIVGGV